MWAVMCVCHHMCHAQARSWTPCSRVKHREGETANWCGRAPTPIPSAIPCGSGTWVVQVLEQEEGEEEVEEEEEEEDEEESDDEGPCLRKGRKGRNMDPRPVTRVKLTDTGDFSFCGIAMLADASTLVLGLDEAKEVAGRAIAIPVRGGQAVVVANMAVWGCDARQLSVVATPFLKKLNDACKKGPLAPPNLRKPQFLVVEEVFPIFTTHSTLMDEFKKVELWRWTARRMRVPHLLGSGWSNPGNTGHWAL